MGGTTGRAKVAYGDESIRVSAEPPMYLVAATIVPPDSSLAELEGMLPRGASKLHWRDLGLKAQRESLMRVAELGSESTVVIAAPINPSKQERARRKAMEALLPLLEGMGVAKLVMESRFPAADAKDVAHFRSMRKKGLVSAIELAFADPSEDHRLWVPDQILGAYSDAAVRSQAVDAWKPEWGALRGSVTSVDVRP